MGDRHDPKVQQAMGRCARLMQELTVARQRNPVPRGLVVRLTRELAESERELSALSPSSRPELLNGQRPSERGLRRTLTSK
jgi:hypothetical protein